MLHLKYMVWFTLRFEVEDFDGDVLEICDVQPTDICLQNMARQNIIVKKDKNRLTHFTEVFAYGLQEDQPVRGFDPLIFRYKISDKSGRLARVTNIDVLDPELYQVYLSNNSGNASGGNLWLNKNGSSTSTDDRVIRGLFPDAGRQSVGVIDIFLNDLVPASHSILSPDKTCAEPEYVVRFQKHP